MTRFGAAQISDVRRRKPRGKGELVLEISSRTAGKTHRTASLCPCLAMDLLFPLDVTRRKTRDREREREREREKQGQARKRGDELLGGKSRFATIALK